MAEAAESGAPEGLLVTFPALVLGPGSGLQPDGQVRPLRRDGIKRIAQKRPYVRILMGNDCGKAWYF